MDTRLVAVFGSASIPQDSVDYATAYAVGQALGRAGFGVMSGGYAGVMGAVSKGANEVGAAVVGVTCGTIEAISGAQVNPWVTQHVHYATLTERLHHLITKADAYVLLPGGLGTLTELMLTWELMRLHELPRRPVVCLGEHWLIMLAAIQATPYVRSQDWGLLHVVDSPADILPVIHRELEA